MDAIAIAIAVSCLRWQFRFEKGRKERNVREPRVP